MSDSFIIFIICFPLPVYILTRWHLMRTKLPGIQVHLHLHFMISVAVHLKLLFFLSELEEIQVHSFPRKLFFFQIAVITRNVTEGTLLDK